MDNFTKEQIESVSVDENGYEFQERLAMLEQNNLEMHPVHARNKALKEIRLRILRDQSTD